MKAGLKRRQVIKEAITNVLVGTKQNFADDLLNSSPKKSKKPRALDKKQKEIVKLVKKIED